MTGVSLKKILKEIVGRSAITAKGAAGDQSLTTTSTVVPLTTYTAKLGNNLTVVNNGVKCEKDGWVLIAAEGYFSGGFTANDIAHLVIRVNSTDLTNAAIRLPSTYIYCSIAPQLYHVTAGTMLYLYAYNQTAARGYITKTYGTWLNVVYL